MSKSQGKKWDLPPPAKVYEAFTAVADERVEMLDSTSAEVTSSTGEKTYLVEWSPDFSEVRSDDNASRWQGYLGYPIIAVYLKTGPLRAPDNIIENLGGVVWKELNEKHNRDYDAAVDDALNSLGLNQDQIKETERIVEDIMRQLEKLNLKKLTEKKNRKNQSLFEYDD